MTLNKPLLLTNFFAGDVVGGLGPYLAIYLLSAFHWSPGEIGLALAAGTITTVLLQTPAGAIIDNSTYKRGLLSGCGLAIGAASISVLFFAAHPPVIYGAQILMGIAIAFVAPCIAAITLGVSGPENFTYQTSANQASNHAGNVFAAALAAVLALLFSAAWVFWLVAIMATLMAISIATLPSSSIDHTVARGGEKVDKTGTPQPSGLGSLLSEHRLIILAVCVFLFHFANAAMLPLVSQKLSLNSDVSEAIAFTSACIIAAQFLMVLMSLLCAAKADVWGRKPLFLIAFIVLPVRGLLFMSMDNPYALVSIQALDGIANGIFGVIILLMVADLTRGTGRFNITQGAMATVVGVGASFSNLIAEEIVQISGYDMAFLSLAAIAFVAGMIFLCLMPETLAKNVADNEPALNIAE